MKCLLATTLRSMLASSAASAEPPSDQTLVGLAIGNRLEVVYPGGGPTVTFDFEADRTFTAIFPGGVPGRGDYVADARYVCWIVLEPVEREPGRNVHCEKNSTEGKAIGQSWTVTDSHGDTPTITIRPRR